MNLSSDPYKTIVSDFVQETYQANNTSSAVISRVDIVIPFLKKVLWMACLTQDAYKYTESDSCRLQVCSLHVTWGGKISKKDQNWSMDFLKNNHLDNISSMN